MTAYDTVENVDSYAATKLHMAAYDRITPENKLKATYEASRLLDGLNYTGAKTDPDQEHEWPRDTDSVINPDILDAFYELTIALATGVSPEKEYENLKLMSSAFASVRSTYDRTSPPEHIVAGIPSFSAWRKLKPYLRAAQELKICRV